MSRVYCKGVDLQVWVEGSAARLVGLISSDMMSIL